MLLSSVVLGLDWFLPAGDRKLTTCLPSLFRIPSTQPVWSRRRLSVCTRSERWKSKCASSSDPCTASLLYSPSRLYTNMLSEAHIQRTFSPAYTLTCWQAGRHTPSHYLCAEQFCSYWCEQRGAVYHSSTAAAGPVQRRAIISRHHTPASPTQGKHPSSLLFYFFFSSLPLSPSLCDAALLTFPFSFRSLYIFSVCHWDSHGWHPYLQPCHLLPGVWTPGTAHAGQWVVWITPPNKLLASDKHCMSA